LAELAPSPTFLIIGVARNATRWLRSNLERHPQICAPPINTGFYAFEERMAALGHRWYREQFADWDGEPFLGEASQGYMFWPFKPAEMAERIGRHLPDVKLIVIVGDPVERLLSAMRRQLRWGQLPADVDPEAYYRLDAHRELALVEIGAGMQHASLAPYAKRFGDQLQIVFHDDVRRDPAGVYRSALEHIGADPSFVPADLATPRFCDRRVVTVAPPLLDTHQFLYAWFRTDVEHLEELTGRDCSAWDPGVNDETPTPRELYAQFLAGASAGPS